jgi:hypothetical protein
MRIKQTLLSLALMVGFSVGLGLLSQPVSAEEPTPNKAQIEAQEAKDIADGCGGAKTSIIKCSQGAGTTTQDNGVWALLMMVLNIMTAGIGILAVGGIAYGAALYASSADKPEQAKQGMTFIKNVVIGLVAYGLMYIILNFLIPGGIFN